MMVQTFFIECIKTDSNGVNDFMDVLSSQTRESLATWTFSTVFVQWRNAWITQVVTTGTIYREFFLKIY